MWTSVDSAVALQSQQMSTGKVTDETSFSTNDETCIRPTTGLGPELQHEHGRGRAAYEEPSSAGSGPSSDA
jgi:hypothetical protein